MSGIYTEEDDENSIIELFQNMGYRYVYAPDLERDFRSPLYEEELVSALHRLNPKLPEDAITDALFKLKNFEMLNLSRKMNFLWIIFSMGSKSGISLRARSAPASSILSTIKILRITPLS